jgi:hypothetical protein
MWGPQKEVPTRYWMTGSNVSNPLTVMVLVTFFVLCPTRTTDLVVGQVHRSGLSMIGNESFAQTSFIPTADANYTAIFNELFYKLTIESTQGYSSLSESGSFPA